MSDYVTIVCPICNSGISFKPEDEAIQCPHCNAVIEKEAALIWDAAEGQSQENFTWDTTGSTWQPGEADGLRSFTCQACGAQILADETADAAECPHCGKALLMDEQPSLSLKPDVVIPFKIAKNDAIAALSKHYKGKRLLPRIFRDQNYVKQITPVFVPVWLFDTEGPVEAYYKGTKHNEWSDADYNYKETSFYAAERKGTISFVNVPVDGASRMDDRFMQSLRPFDFSEAIPFEKSCLCGCLAAQCDVAADVSASTAEDWINRSLKNGLLNTVSGYTGTTQMRCNFALTGKPRLALLPVWLLNTRWNGQVFTFMMNGQTGEFVGDLPMDKAAYWKWTIGTGLAGAAAAAAVNVLIWLANLWMIT